MPSISTNQNGIFWEDELTGNKETLLDYQSKLINSGCIISHSNSVSHKPLQRIMRKYLQDCKDLMAEDSVLKTYLMLTLVTKQVLQCTTPPVLLECGCGDGALSYFLASVLGDLQEQSRLFCLNDIIDPGWLDRIGQVKYPPDINYLASNYKHTGLQQDFFDMVVINGTTYFKDPDVTLQEAIRVLKPDGLLICYSENNPLMESVFQLYFDCRRQYVLNYTSMIQKKKKSDYTWE